MLKALSLLAFLLFPSFATAQIPAVTAQRVGSEVVFDLHGVNYSTIKITALPGGEYLRCDHGEFASDIRIRSNAVDYTFFGTICRDNRCTPYDFTFSVDAVSVNTPTGGIGWLGCTALIITSVIVGWSVGLLVLIYNDRKGWW